LEKCNITVNKNAVPGDLKPFVPGGIRIGTPACTTRGLKEKEFSRVGEFVDRGIKLALQINAQGENSKKLKTFMDYLESHKHPEIEKLSEEVSRFSQMFPMPSKLD